MDQPVRKHILRSFLFTCSLLLIQASIVLPLQAQYPDTVTAQDEYYDTSRLKHLVDSISTTAESDDEWEPAEETEETIISFLDRDSSIAFGSSLSVRKVPDSVRRNLANDDDYWYANYTFFKKKEDIRTRKSRDPWWLGSTVRTLLWLIIIALFIGVIAIYLGSNRISLFRRSRDIRDTAEEEAQDDIFSIHFGKEIEKAAAAGNYRLAVRYHFLQLLRKLSDKKFIQYQVDRTNFDYLMQLQASSLYTDFFRLTRNYEYSWYGQFELDRAKFDVIAKDFEKFGQQLK